MDSQLIYALLSAVIGAGAAAYFGYKFALRQFEGQRRIEEDRKRVDTALSFFEELTGDAFSQARSETSKIFKRHIADSSFDDFYSGLKEEEKQSIRKVLSFFRRLQLAVHYKRVDEQMVVDLLSGEFIHWHFMWLDKLTPKTWDTRINIDSLDSWLQKNMALYEYGQKKERAMKAREALLRDYEKTSGDSL